MEYKNSSSLPPSSFLVLSLFHITSTSSIKLVAPPELRLLLTSRKKNQVYTQPFKMEEEDEVFYVAKASRPTTWDHDAHLTLLQAVMIEAHPTKPQWEKILKRVQSKGYNYTQAAVL